MAQHNLMLPNLCDEQLLYRKPLLTATVCAAAVMPCYVCACSGKLELLQQVQPRGTPNSGYPDGLRVVQLGWNRQHGIAAACLYRSRAECLELQATTCGLLIVGSLATWLLVNLAAVAVAAIAAVASV